MSNDIDLRAIWQSQKKTPPSVQAFSEQAQQIRRLQLTKWWITNILLGLTFVAIIIIWLVYQPQMLSTKIGLILILLAMAFYFASSVRLKPTLTSISADDTSREFLDKLLRLKEGQRIMHTRVLSAYFLLLSTGMGLYLIEPTGAMGRMQAIIAWTCTGGWIVFNWFYIRPRTIRKQNKAIEKTIDQIKQYRRQIEESDVANHA